MKDGILTVVLLSAVWSLRLVGSDVPRIRPATAAAKAVAAALAPAEQRTAAGDSDPSASSADARDNGTSPCDRYLRSAEVEVRNPRNHKFVTSNGWTERQRPRPEISVYSRIEELPSPQPSAATAPYYQQQRDSFYQQLPPTVRTSKRIIYYATLPDVIRPPAGYPPQSPPSYSSDPFALGPGPYSADFRQLDANRNVPPPPDSVQRNRLTSYENVYNRGGNGVTSSVTSKSTAVYNSRYDEPAEFRDAYYRPNEFASKFASWTEPFYKSWTSSSWDKDSPSYESGKFRGGPSSWDREPLSKGAGPWDNRGSTWDSNRGSSWDNRGSSWDKELVEVPLRKPDGSRGGGGNNFDNNDKYPEVAVVHSGVIDVRGDRGQQNGRGSPQPQPPSPQAAPPPRFTIIDVDPKPYRQPQQVPASMRYEPPQKPMQYEPPQKPMQYEPPQKPMRYETYTPMEPHTRYEQQYRQPQLPPTRYGQNHNDKQPSNGYYENIKNNINTHQFMTSWTEVSSTQNEVLPTHTVDVNIPPLGNSSSMQNNTKITMHTSTAKTPK